MLGAVRLWSLLVLALLVGMATASAQNAGTDEAMTPQGTVTQSIGLTPAQKSSIYNEVLRQRVLASTAGIEPTIGASVPRSARLAELPDYSGIADWAFLKYAMVADDLVIVDPIKMRVVDVIHGNMGP